MRLLLATSLCTTALVSALVAPRSTVRRGTSLAAQPMESLRFLSADEARAAKETYGTPVYVYDADTLRARASEALAFPNAYGVTVRYAMKACPNGAVLRLFADMGLHFDASSTHEVRRAMAAGVPASRLSLSTQQLDDDAFELVRDHGLEVNACSLYQIEALAANVPGAKVGVRFNPGLGSGGTAKTNVGGPSSSFGIWHGEFAAVVDAASNLDVVRVHTHIGSGSDPAVWTRVARLSLDLCERLGDGVKTLNLGGGYKVGRMIGEVSTDLGEVGAPVKAEFEDYAKRTGVELGLEVEPGTYLVANAGALVSTIQDVACTKSGGGPGEGGHDFLKLDCGMTDVLRPSLYGAQHPLVVVAADAARDSDAATAPYVVVGHCCESGDLLTCAPDEPETLAPRELKACARGDLVVVESVGAYCAAMSTAGYNSFPTAPEVMRGGDGAMHLIRKRSTLDQLLQNEVEVDAAAL
mmetsp:Transcript_22700/g.70173  ORF Transcript_22700/g.70173 Transcript_22700/m.70173 type:complete len:468 (-) Transcript_22700:63-1466(-)